MLPPFPTPPADLGHEPAVSIVITNRDYAAYLPAALRSALEQRAPRVEVLVVDDGSTDDSREIIASYGDSVRTLLLDGAGQKAAFNAALEIVRGDIVLFLDSDDALHPGTAAAVAAAFADHPSAARAVFRLDVVDGDGRSWGACVPPAATPLPHGDVRQEVLTHPDDLPWPAFGAPLRMTVGRPVAPMKRARDACLVQRPPRARADRAEEQGQAWASGVSCLLDAEALVEQARAGWTARWPDRRPRRSRAATARSSRSATS